MRRLLLCLALVACGDDDDAPSFDASTVDVAGGDPLDAGIDAGDVPECPATRLGSCVKAGGRCIEVFADPSVEKAVAATCTEDQTSTWRSRVACEPEGVVGTCELAVPGACQTFFYSPPFDAGTAQTDCESTGGVFTPL